MFLGSVGTYLYSKEILIMDHEFYVGTALFILLFNLNRKFGPDLKEYMFKLADEEEAKLKAIRQDEIDR